ncbi:MAG TPA: hypothetical protein VFD59_07230 [Nocardioidaceae bacterium]|nr:hypothetical protein [Nocardioidaceae bacterium]
MIIIAGHELVDVEDRDAHVAAFADLVARARAAECIHVAITADSIDPERCPIGPGCPMSLLVETGSRR